MPPKKSLAPTQSQKALAQAVAAAYERKPEPLSSLPDATSIPPLWTPTATPKELFPEWPSAGALATENWGSDDAPFEDPLPPVGFLATERPIVWKRPSEYLPLIAEPTPSALAPVAPDPKHAANAKKAAPAPAKKGEPEPPKKPKAPKYAHIVYVPAPEIELHAASTAADAKATKPGAPVSHPATPAVVTEPQPPPRRIVHDFTRLWSPEQQEDLAAWRREEVRITRETEHRERIFMEFEDAIAFIINGRPRTLNEDDVRAEDLEDDGQDDDEQEDESAGADSSPFGGFLPPSTIDIAANAVVKPEVPHGDVVQASFASYFRIVDQLYQQWASSPLGSEANSMPYLWEAIYPQDAHGVPIYNHAGKYSVRLYLAGKWRRVDVDDKLPVDDEGKIQLVSSSMKNELWPTILAKALIKVSNWIGVEDRTQNPRFSDSTESIRLTSLVITALASWKVTRHESAAVFAGNFQSLQEYVPQVQPSDPQNELLSLDEADGNQAGTGEESPAESTKTCQGRMPRAVIVSTASVGPQHLAYQEASLLYDIIGDTGSINLKAVNLNGTVSIKEEELSVDVAAFLIIHPTMSHADLLFELWPVNASGIAEPSKNPTTQFCVINTMMKTETQSAGDASSERSTGESEGVRVVVSLCRVPPNCSSNEGDGNVNSELAKHLGVDPRGSVLLVEDLDLEKYRHRLSGQVCPKRRPMVFELDTSSSTLLELPCTRFECTTFRVYPQTTCRYGYSLLVESDVKVDWQVASTYWRNVWDLQVIEGDGVYPAMLPGSWNILFKQNIELAPHGEDPSSQPSALPELHVDLHLSDADLGSAIHVYFVNQHGDRVISLSGLHGGAVLPEEAATYSLIVECRPRKLIPEGKWHMTVGSNRMFKHASIHQPRLTIFGGVYVPNKSLVCLRDVVQGPKKTTSIGLQFELLDSDMRKVADLAACLQVVDLVSGQSLTQQSGVGLVRLLQLPPYTKSADDPNEDKSGYIIQCGIDKTTCHVDTQFQSVRPFSNKQSEPPKEKPIAEGDEVQEVLKETKSQELRWRLMCWSVDEVKLEFDRAQELRFEAIRASWAETAKDRDAHGASSRLMFLGKHDAAAAAMAEDGLSEEQVTKYKARAEWIQTARTKIAGCSEHDHIDIQAEVSPDMEELRQAQDLENDHARYQAMMDEMDAFIQLIRDERTSAKETRTAALKDQVQAFIDERKEAEKQRQALYNERDDVRAKLQASSAGVAG